MSKLVLLALSLVLIILIAGCTQQPTGNAIQQTKYVCSDGSTVSDPSLCPKTATQPQAQQTSCNPNWSCTEWSICSSVGTQSRTCTDLNNCGTISDKPVESQTCTPPCISNWQCGSWSVCSSSGVQTRVCTDSNNCGTATDKPIGTQSCSPPQPTIEILSHSSYTDSIGYLHIVGEVENTETSNVNFIEVIATLYDMSNKVVGTSFTYATMSILVPNQKSPFEIIELSTSGEAKSYKLQTTFSRTSAQPYTELKILSHSSYTDSIGYYHVVGEIKNEGDKDKNFVKVVGTFYDSSGKVVATGFTYTNPNNIPSGQTSPFEIIVLSQSQLIDHYELQVDG